MFEIQIQKTFIAILFALVFVAVILPMSVFAHTWEKSHVHCGSPGGPIREAPPGVTSVDPSFCQDEEPFFHLGTTPAREDLEASFTNFRSKFSDLQEAFDVQYDSVNQVLSSGNVPSATREIQQLEGILADVRRLQNEVRPVYDNLTTAQEGSFLGLQLEQLMDSMGEMANTGNGGDLAAANDALNALVPDSAVGDSVLDTVTGGGLPDESVYGAEPELPASVCPTGTVKKGGVCLPTGAALGIQDDSVANIFTSVILFVTSVIGFVSILMIIIAGLMYMLSAGDQTRVETSKKILTYAIIGLTVALLAWVIVSIISRVFGAGGLSSNGSNGGSPGITGTETTVCVIPEDSSTCITYTNEL